MVCDERRPVIWMRGLVVAAVGFGGMVFVSSMSLAQYPGSAGNLNTGAVGVSSPASSSASSSASSYGGVSSDGLAGGSMVSSNSSSGGSDGRDDYGARIADALLPRESLRKRALIRQFRLEYAKILTIETANKRPLSAVSSDVYLDQFSKELDTGLVGQADVNSLGRDLGLLRNALDDRLDVVIANYGGDATQRGFFSKTASAGGSASALRAEIHRLKIKHELLVFGEYSLQAMGYYVK